MAKADEAVFLWLNGWVGRFDPLDRAVEWVVSDYMVPAAMALTLIGLWFAGSEQTVRLRYQLGVFVALTSLGMANWAVFIINWFYFRPRPFVDHEVSLLFYRPTDSSFPSNPAAVTFAIAAAVWVVDRRVGALLAVAASLYAVARVYAGVHYPLDIVASAVIAVAATFLAFKLIAVLEPIPTMAIKAARILCLA